jgi:hypothetical protein
MLYQLYARRFPYWSTYEQCRSARLEEVAALAQVGGASGGACLGSLVAAAGCWLRLWLQAAVADLGWSRVFTRLACSCIRSSPETGTGAEPHTPGRRPAPRLRPLAGDEPRGRRVHQGLPHARLYAASDGGRGAGPPLVRFWVGGGAGWA